MATRTTTTRTTQTTFGVPGDGAPSPILSPAFVPATLTLEALFDAYFDCRRHKRNSESQLSFEHDLEANLMALWRELNDGSYRIGPGVAFVVRYPKLREVWAAAFRDRIVHHLIYNALKDRFHRRFIRDSYACIPGRGTHDGMRRVAAFARSVTANWTRPAFVLKADIANFFNSIERERLLAIVLHLVPEQWLQHLVRQTVLHDPRPGADLHSSRALFAQIPPHKSLMRAPDGFGLPIGNLTSQFFANVYLNELDHFVKHNIGCRYYGRYVDDILLFHEDSSVLGSHIPNIDAFLRDRLALRLHPNKTSVNRADAGINFAGFVIKPGRTYLRRSTVGRAKQRIGNWKRSGAPLDPASLAALSHSLTSTLGMLRAVNGYRARRDLCADVESLFLHADSDYTKIWTTLR